MGRSTGWIALHAGWPVRRTDPTPRSRSTWTRSARHPGPGPDGAPLLDRRGGGRAAPAGGAVRTGEKGDRPRGPARGVAEWLGGKISARTGKETRTIVSAPAARRRPHRLRPADGASLRHRAVRARGRSTDVMVALRPPSVVAFRARRRGGQAQRPPDGDTIATALSLESAWGACDIMSRHACGGRHEALKALFFLLALALLLDPAPPSRTRRVP
jgi:hypothetical protein